MKKISSVFLVAILVSLSFSSYPLRANAGEIYDTKKSIDKTQEQIEAAQAALKASQNKYQTNQTQISTTKNVIAETQDAIEEKEKQINDLSQRIELNKKILESYIQEMSYSSNDDMAVTFAVSNSFLHDFSGNFDGMVSVKEKVLLIIDQISQDKVDLGDAKDELDQKKQEKQQYLNGKQAEQAEVASDIQETQASISELQKKLVELQSDLLALTGKSFSAKDIKEAVEFASDETGVPEGVLYGFLKAETNLGKNTGQCTYKQVKSDAIKLWYGTSSKWKNSRALLDERMDIFYDLVDDLGYDKDKKVSCTPRSYRGQGGAMGVAQFMSDVWRSYESSIRSRTGHKSPDPWDITDGVMAMAIKLKGAGATSSSKSTIKKASINYLGGFSASYYETIVYWSNNYKTLFD